MAEERVQREGQAAIMGQLRTNFSVVRNIADVNPRKENVIAIIWERQNGTYKVVRQIRETFDENYQFVMPYRTDTVRNRTPGDAPHSPNQAQSVIIGREFTSHNARNAWVRFKDENPRMTFGMGFVNHCHMEFRLLSADRLKAKFNHLKNIVRRKIDIVKKEKDKYKRMMKKHDLKTFKRINVTNAEECVRVCLLSDIWQVFHLMSQQLGRENDVTERMSQLRAELREKNDEKMRTFRQECNSFKCSPQEIEQFVNLGTMSVMDKNPDYSRYLQDLRVLFREH